MKATSWVVARSRARDGILWHIQARTEDQLSSFACTVFGTASLLRTMTPDGKSQIFTLSQLDPHVTFTIVGKIRYVNDWDGIP